jgi:NADH-quinone oxidoreductase subunit G
VDHRIRESDFSDQLRRPLFPKLNISIAEIEQCDTILLVGSNIRNDQPILSTRLFKAYQEGLKILAVNPEDYNFVYPLAEKIIDDNILQSLSDIVAALKSTSNNDSAIRIAAQLREAKNAAIFVGAYAAHHPHAAIIRDLVHQIADLSGAKAGLLTEGSNSAGAWISGCIPHRGPANAAVQKNGRDAKALLTTDPVAAYFILNTELENDAAYAEKAMEVLAQAKLVVCLNTFATEKMREYADFILPITPYSENEGTYVNVEGTWQSFHSVGPTHGESKPAWKVLRALGTVMQLPGFDYTSAHNIRDEIQAQLTQVTCCEDCKKVVDVTLPAYTKVHVPTWRIYRDNALVRRAKALQEIHDGESL